MDTMAAAEDDSEFSSHFLDSMLEVEMTEEDGEVEISKNEDPADLNSRTLPPIPMFDLQSETLTYKDVYKGPVLAPLAAVPTADTVPRTVPVLNSGSMISMYSREMRPAGTSPLAKSESPATPKVASKVAKPMVKDSVPKVSPTGSSFVKKIFKPEYVEHVFTQKESDGDTSVYGKEEMEFYKSCFTDLTKIQYCRLHCTICDRHIGCGANVEKRLTVHAMLKVMTCNPCHEFYGDGNFPCDQGDNCEIYCRWCGQGGALVCCSFCPRVFCKLKTSETLCNKVTECDCPLIVPLAIAEGEILGCLHLTGFVLPIFLRGVIAKKCVKLNFGVNFLKNIQRVSDWACFCCAQKPLWPHRAVCRALVEYTNMRKTDGKPAHRDTSKCCATSLWKKQWRPTDKIKMPPPPGQMNVSQVSAGNSVTTTPAKSRVLPPVKPLNRKEQSVLKPQVEVKLNNQNKSSIDSFKLSKDSPVTNVLSKSIISGNKIFRGITTSAPAKIFSTIPPPQLIQAPVLHGETLITPPNSRMIASPKIIATPAPAPASPYVRVSLTNQTANMDMNKIPLAKIPHDVQSLILRLTFPDNKVQLVRLVSDGNGCKASKQFPMPEFKNLDKASFVEENLSDSFRLSKMLFDRLMFVKEKVNAKTKDTEDAVLESSVEKLHFVYEKSAELLKELDATLMEKYELWKNRKKNPVDLIDLSGDESSLQKTKQESDRREKFLQKCKELVLSEDSDVEILDDANASKRGNPKAGTFKEPFINVQINGDSNPKERMSTDKPKAFDNSRIAKKRKGKKGRKRLKLTDNTKKEENRKNYIDHAALQSLMAKLQEARAKRESAAETEVAKKKTRKQSLNATAENPVENGVTLIQK